MNHGENGDSNKTQKEVDHSNPKEENRSQPENDIVPKGSDSNSLTQERGEHNSFEIQHEGTDLKVGSPPIEDQT